MAACTWREVLVFVIGLISGTGCSLASKMLLTAESVGMTGEVEKFEDPLFQSWIMFVAMTCALPIHFAYEYWERRKGSEEQQSLKKGINPAIEVPKPSMPTWTYFILAVPACFDLLATVLCMFGLLHISASVYQLLRGACIVFVALMKHYLLKDRLKGYNWVGVCLLALAITLVGLTSVLGAGSDDMSGGARTRRTHARRRWSRARARQPTHHAEPPPRPPARPAHPPPPPPRGRADNPLLGVALILCGTFVQSLQYAFEEKVMTGDVSAPPLLVIGMEVRARARDPRARPRPIPARPARRARARAGADGAPATTAATAFSRPLSLSPVRPRTAPLGRLRARRACGAR